MTVARYRLSVDYTSATQSTDDGHTVFTPNVNVTGGSGLSTSATIVGPLGTNAIAAAVSVTPATSSVWPASQSGTWNITNVSGTVSLPTGASTEATLAAASAKLPASLGPKAASASLSVTPAGLLYETVAASQTAQVLGGSGATGDYLSHVILQPTSTAAGTMTILDNATVIFTFTTGTLADLRPITIPIGAYSVSGAWKITTGANETATAFGIFT